MKVNISLTIQWFLILVMGLVTVQVANAKTGAVSWYGKYHHGRLTASGERFNMHAMTAAHKTLPFGTVVSVKNIKTGKTIKVTINDRGPYVGNRVFDLSYGAARRLGIDKQGVGTVNYTIVKRGGQTYRADTRTKRDFLKEFPNDYDFRIKSIGEDPLLALINDLENDTQLLARSL